MKGRAFLPQSISDTNTKVKDRLFHPMMKTTLQIHSTCLSFLCLTLGLGSALFCAPHSAVASRQQGGKKSTAFTPLSTEPTHKRSQVVLEPLPSTGESMTLTPSGKHKDTQTAWHGAALVTIVRGDPQRREVALTFDDGPHPAFTPRLLELLQQLNVRATFFLVGKKVDRAPGLVARILAEGHDVANHTYDHVNLGHAPLELAENEIRLGNEAIHRACGTEPLYFRPPGGHHEPGVLAAAEKMNMTTVLWTDDPADYANPGAEIIESRLLKHIRNGAVILLHDGIEQTFEILPDLVARLRHDGYRFVTMSEMAQHLETNHSAHR